MTAFPGWTLAEAFERLVPEKILCRSREAWEHARSVNARVNDGTSWITTPGYDLDRAHRQSAMLRQVQTEAGQLEFAVFDHLRSLASHGKVAGFGILGGTTGDAVAIRADQWAGFDGHMTEVSGVGWRSRSGALRITDSYFSVHLYPTLRAPNAADLVAGSPLRALLEDNVFADAEAEKRLQDGLLSDGPPPKICLPQTGDAPLLVDLSGRVSYIRRQIADLNLVERVGLATAFTGSDLADRWLDVVADRLVALSELIATSAVGFTGIVPGGAARDIIPSIVIETGQLLLCLTSGRLYDAEDRSAPAYDHVRTQAAAPSVANADKAPATFPTAQDRTPHNDAEIVADRIRERWPDEMPPGTTSEGIRRLFDNDKQALGKPPEWPSDSTIKNAKNLLEDQGYRTNRRKRV